MILDRLLSRRVRDMIIKQGVGGLVWVHSFMSVELRVSFMDGEEEKGGCGGLDFCFGDGVGSMNDGTGSAHRCLSDLSPSRHNFSWSRRKTALLFRVGTKCVYVELVLLSF